MSIPDNHKYPGEGPRGGSYDAAPVARDPSPLSISLWLVYLAAIDDTRNRIHLRFRGKRPGIVIGLASGHGNGRRSTCLTVMASCSPVRPTTEREAFDRPVYPAATTVASREHTTVA